MENYFNEWLKILNKQQLINIVDNLNEKYKNEEIIIPEKNHVFKAFNYCKYSDLKVVMIFENYDNGILNHSNIEILKNSIVDNYEIKPVIFDNTFKNWNDQGILTINSSLVTFNNSDIFWKPFITNMLINLSNYNTGIIYVLFGKSNQYKKYINKYSNFIFEEQSISSYDNMITSNLFIHLSKLIKDKYNISIDWYKTY